MSAHETCTSAQDKEHSAGQHAHIKKAVVTGLAGLCRVVAEANVPKKEERRHRSMH